MRNSLKPKKIGSEKLKVKQKQSQIEIDLDFYRMKDGLSKADQEKAIAWIEWGTLIPRMNNKKELLTWLSNMKDPELRSLIKKRIREIK